MAEASQVRAVNQSLAKRHAALMMPLAVAASLRVAIGGLVLLLMLNRVLVLWRLLLLLSSVGMLSCTKLWSIAAGTLCCGPVGCCSVIRPWPLHGPVIAEAHAVQSTRCSPSQEELQSVA